MGRELDSELQAELAAAAGRVGCELLDVELRGTTLRLILDRREGVTLADCEAVSRQASAILDLADFGAGRYTLEVSSPGLDRKLYTPADFERFVGKKVRVTWREGEDGRKQTLIGRLEEFDRAGDGVVRLVTGAEREPCAIPLPAIEIARLEIEL